MLLRALANRAPSQYYPNEESAAADENKGYGDETVDVVPAEAYPVFPRSFTTNRG